MRGPASPSPVTVGAEAQPDTLGAAAATAAPRKPRKLPSMASFASISSITKVFSKRRGSSKSRTSAAAAAAAAAAPPPHHHHHRHRRQHHNHDLESCAESSNTMPREGEDGGDGGGDGRGRRASSSSSGASSVVATCGGPRIRRNFSFQSSARQQQQQQPAAAAAAAVARKVSGQPQQQQQARVFTEPADRTWGFGSLRRIAALPRSKTMGVLPTMRTAAAAAAETAPVTSRLPLGLRRQKTGANIDERHVTEAQPTAYWAGRFCSISDQLRTKEADRALAATPIDAPPSQQQACLGNNECDAQRIFLILEMTCLTPDAYRSFKVFKEAFLQISHERALRPRRSSDASSYLGGVSVGGSVSGGDSDDGVRRVGGYGDRNGDRNGGRNGGGGGGGGRGRGPTRAASWSALRTTARRSSPSPFTQLPSSSSTRPTATAAQKVPYRLAPPPPPPPPPPSGASSSAVVAAFPGPPPRQALPPLPRPRAALLAASRHHQKNHHQQQQQQRQQRLEQQHQAKKARVASDAHELGRGRGGGGGGGGGGGRVSMGSKVDSASHRTGGGNRRATTGTAKA